MGDTEETKQETKQETTQEDQEKDETLVVSIIPAKVDAVHLLEQKLDSDIGWQYWKKYVAAAFWAQISMPMNLVITLLTALTTAQANAPDLLPESLYKSLTYVSLLLTVLNTFFRPHEKLTTNVKLLKEWTAQGIAYEKVVMSETNLILKNRGPSCLSQQQIETLQADFQKVRDEVNAQRQKEGPEMINFVTDLLHILSFYTCIRKHQKWSNIVGQ